VELSNSFDVARPIDEAWRLLSDVERVAPCVPGAQLREAEGNNYRGIVRVRLGPITTEYAGTASVIEQNDTDYKLVLSGLGLDAGDNGNAAATVTTKLEPISDHTTRVNVDTDLTITGRVAQLSKSVIPDVSAMLFAQFAENLAILAEADEAPSVAPPADRAHRRQIDMPEPEAIDLMDAARTPFLKRLAVLVMALLVLRWLVKR
jgi:carbon monoxide dehydrogenase subunit G